MNIWICTLPIFVSMSLLVNDVQSLINISNLDKISNQLPKTSNDPIDDDVNQSSPGTRSGSHLTAADIPKFLTRKKHG